MAILATNELEEMGLTSEYVETLTLEDVQKPNFPIMIFFAAIIKDIIDIPSLGFLGPITSAMLGIVIWFWIMGKTSFMRKMLLKKVIWKSLVFEVAPGVSAAPVASFGVILAHKKEGAMVEIFWKIIENDLSLEDILEEYKKVIK